MANNAEPGRLRRRQFLRASAILPPILALPPLLFAADYDLVIRGGRVLDASQRLDQVADVGIRDGKIAAIRPTSPGPQPQRRSRPPENW
jgi:hypothetical protein